MLMSCVGLYLINAVFPSFSSGFPVRQNFKNASSASPVPEVFVDYVGVYKRSVYKSFHRRVAKGVEPHSSKIKSKFRFLQILFFKTTPYLKNRFSTTHVNYLLLVITHPSNYHIFDKLKK